MPCHSRDSIEAQARLVNGGIKVQCFQMRIIAVPNPYRAAGCTDYRLGEKNSCKKAQKAQSGKAATKGLTPATFPTA